MKLTSIQMKTLESQKNGEREEVSAFLASLELVFSNLANNPRPQSVPPAETGNWWALEPTSTFCRCRTH